MAKKEIMGHKVTLKSMGKNYDLWENDKVYVVEHKARNVVVQKDKTTPNALIDLILDLNDSLKGK